MQLNNLVIIPSIHPIGHHFSSPMENYKLADQNSASCVILNEQIAWKKSQSAFKKFKTKKDSNSKNTKNSQSLIPILCQVQQTPKEQKLFFLVEKSVNSSLQAIKNQQTFKDKQNLLYFDPNKAPYFQYGKKYILKPTQGKVQIEQNETQAKDNTVYQGGDERLLQNRQQKRTSNLNEQIKFQKCKNFQTNQKSLKAKKQALQIQDPFIIIKNNRQITRDFHSSVSGETEKKSRKQHRKSTQSQLRKTKLIIKQEGHLNKKKSKSYINCSLSRSYSQKQFQKQKEIDVQPQKPYSVGYIEQYEKEKSFVSEKSNEIQADDYEMGNQLNFIEFDLKKHLSSAYSVEESEQNCPWLPQSEKGGKKQQQQVELNSTVIHATRSKITYPKEYYDSDKIIQQYEFSFNDKDRA